MRLHHFKYFYGSLLFIFAWQHFFLPSGAQCRAAMEILLVLLKCRLDEYRHRGMSAQWMSAPWNRLGGSRLMSAPSPVPFIHSMLCTLLWVANVPCKFLLSAAIFIGSYHFEPVPSLRSSTYVRLGLPLPRLPSSLPSIVASRVSECPDVFLIMWPA